MSAATSVPPGVGESEGRSASFPLWVRTAPERGEFAEGEEETPLLQTDEAEEETLLLKTASGEEEYEEGGAAPSSVRLGALER